MSNRKPHSNLAGYRAEQRNPLTGDYTIIFDCQLAEEQGAPLVDDWREEGGRYQVVCNAHATLVYVSSMRAARSTMHDTTEFCDQCRELQEAKR